MRYLLGLVLLSSCATFLSTDRIALDPFEYWSEAEYRIDYWLSWHPECQVGVHGPFSQPVINSVVPSDAIATCDYNPFSRQIRYRPGVEEGCMAHELGHATLHQAGHPCWRRYEHDL